MPRRSLTGAFWSASGVSRLEAGERVRWSTPRPRPAVSSPALALHVRTPIAADERHDQPWGVVHGGLRLRASAVGYRSLMDDESILGRIESLVEEEHALLGREQADASEDEALAADRQRLERVSVELNRCWDLLRPRRARRSAGQDPDEAQERDAEILEKFQQKDDEDAIVATVAEDAPVIDARREFWGAEGIRRWWPRKSLATCRAPLDRKSTRLNSS